MLDQAVHAWYPTLHSYSFSAFNACVILKGICIISSAIGVELSTISPEQGILDSKWHCVQIENDVSALSDLFL